MTTRTPGLKAEQIDDLALEIRDVESRLFLGKVYPLRHAPGGRGLVQNARLRALVSADAR